MYHNPTLKFRISIDLNLLTITNFIHFLILFSTYIHVFTQFHSSLNFPLLLNLLQSPRLLLKIDVVVRIYTLHFVNVHAAGAALGECENTFIYVFYFRKISFRLELVIVLAFPQTWICDCSVKKVRYPLIIYLLHCTLYYIAHTYLSGRENFCLTVVVSVMVRNSLL